MLLIECIAAQRTGKRDQDNKFVSVSQRGYQYNAYGQLAQIDDHLRGTTRYHYDALDRLTQVDGPNPETFVHDPAGNILGSYENENTNTQQQSNGNRLAFYGDNHYRYDERGNRTVVARGKQQCLQQHFAYNALNQLESVENQKQKNRFQYDALGRRVSKVSAHSETQFLWLDNALLSETTTQANNKIPTAKIYLFEPGTHKPLAIVQDSEIYHYHLDHLGTPQEITNSRGKLAWSASFKAYGNLAVVHNNEIDNNLRFQGQYYDEETGLHYNRFRYYDPECGRFISQDPIGLLGGVNNYQYVPNPTGWVDLLGLSCKEGYAYIYHFQGAESPHFAVVTELSGKKYGTEQWGGNGTKTLDIEFFSEEEQSMQLVDVYKVKLPDANAAMQYQKDRVRAGEIALSKAGGDPERLNTPTYDATKKSCLTHVFGVLNAGGKEAPDESPANMATARYMKGLKKESELLKSGDV